MRILYLLLLLPVISFGQSTISSEDRQKANAFYSASDWHNAAIAYQKIADAEPQNWNARTRLGASLIANGKAKEAVRPLEDAIKIGKNNQSMYYLACAYASLNQPEQAFEQLQQATNNGFALLTVFDDDKSFGKLKSDPRYSKGRDGIVGNVYPCRKSEKSREFDFWIGEWDVKNLQGLPAGKSKIEIILGDCVILENWTSALPNLYSGKSFNLYNPTTKKWMQTWVDDKGAVTEFINGEYKDDKMVFVTLPNPQNAITRLTFHKITNDQVRQLFETTKDDGKTWTTSIDLMYHRVK
jgi:hypothetical protein